MILQKGPQQHQSKLSISSFASCPVAQHVTKQRRRSLNVSWDFNTPTPVFELKSITGVSAAICTLAQKTSQELVNGTWLPCEWPAPFTLTSAPLTVLFWKSNMSPLWAILYWFGERINRGGVLCIWRINERRHTWKLFCLLISKYTNYIRDLRVYFASWAHIHHDFNCLANLWRGRHIIFKVHQIASKNMGCGVEPCCISSSLHINPLVLWREGWGSRATCQRHHLLSWIGWLQWKQGIPPPQDELRLPTTPFIFFSENNILSGRQSFAQIMMHNKVGQHRSH